MEAGRLKTRSAYTSYEHLATLLAEGWQVEPPVYVRPRLKSRILSKRQDTYHFVVRLGNAFGLISVLDCPQVQQLLEEEGLGVDRL